MWDPVRPILDRQFDFAALDLLGHGASEPAPPGVTLADLADDVADRIAPATHLIGFSLGALVCQHLAVFRPDLSASVTSVNSVHRRTEQERASVLGRLKMAASDYPGSVEASIERWFPAGEPQDQQAVSLIRRRLLANNIQSYLNCYQVFATADEQLANQLERISVPALAVTGELDTGSTPEMTRRLAKAIPGCKAVVVPGARHMMPIQKPHSLAETITSFIREKSYVQ